jgi:hypothetical protein
MRMNSSLGIRTLIYEEIRKSNSVLSKIEIYKVRRNSQDSYPFWLIFILALLLLALLAVLIGAIVVFGSKREPGTYQMDCLRRSCAPGFGLKCINSTCLCPSNDYYYSTKCELRKSYDKYCNNYQDQCKQRLACFNGKCLCHKTQYWNGRVCSNKVSYGQNCEFAECMDSFMLVCDPSIKQCVCESDRFWSGDTCYMRRNYTDRCMQTGDCIEYRGLLCLSGYCKTRTVSLLSLIFMIFLKGLCNLTYMYFDSTSLICEMKKNESALCTSNIMCLGDMICAFGTCQCLNASTHYFEYKNLTCVPKTLNYTSCYENRTCRSDLGLSCHNDFCQCSSDLFWNFNNCSNPLSYSESICTSDAHCQSDLGLICNGYPTTFTCNCPTGSSPGICDCPIDKFWNENQCVQRFIDYENCSYSYQCISDLICDTCSLTCVNSSVCQSGWSLYNGKCYRIFFSIEYNNAVAHCSSLYPENQSQLAIVDSSIFNFIDCKFNVKNSRAYINSTSTINCPLVGNSGSCYSIRNSNPRCESHNCNCGVRHDAICEYTL